METLRKVIKLKQMKDAFEEKLSRLNAMRGTYNDGENPPESKANVIRFESEFVSTVVLGGVADPELNVILVEAAVKHLEHRIEEMTKLLNQVDTMLGGLEWDV